VRECGPCHACCIHLPIADKPPHVPCADLSDGRCRLYAERPDVCRRFLCLWRQGELWDSARPDKCGILVQPVVYNGGLRFNVIEIRPGVLDRNSLVLTACKFLPCSLVRVHYFDGRVLTFRRTGSMWLTWEQCIKEGET
jgi:Fe-S-cluster containining protein